jgi:hypothetical protein
VVLTVTCAANATWRCWQRADRRAAPRPRSTTVGDAVELEFTGELWFWRGPAPWYFVTVPEAESRLLEDESPFVSYGWGMIPVTARIGGSAWDTALFPKDGRYVVPVKAAVRTAERLDEGDRTLVRLAVRAPDRAPRPSS